MSRYADAMPRRQRVSEYGPEELLQRAVWSWWLLAGKRAYPMVGMRAVPNGSLRAKSVAVRLKAAGVVAGVADFSLTIGPEGRAAWIELKRPEIRGATKIVQRKGTQSDPQRDFEREELERGALYAVCDCLEQVIATIAKWTGLPPVSAGAMPKPRRKPPANDPIDLSKILTAC
jgi:hypothetical protein